MSWPRNVWRRYDAAQAKQLPTAYVYCVRRGETTLAYYADHDAAVRAARDIFRGAEVVAATAKRRTHGSVRDD